MKHFLKQLLVLCLICIVTNTYAVINVTIDGIYYSIDGNEATVKESSKKYTGSITIPSTVTYGSNKYTEKQYKVTSIDNFAFYNCIGLTDITIPNSINVIGHDAFRGCSGLANITIPNSVTEIGHTAFYNCENLSNITLSNQITRINDETFRGCCGLTSIIIPNSVTEIGENAFYKCGNLDNIFLPEGLKTIGKTAFGSCVAMTSITIPESVTTIENSAFYGCKGLKSVHIKNLEAWCKIEFGMSDSNPLSYAEHLYLNGEEIVNLTIPENVTSIGKYAFDGCDNIIKVTIPNSVTSIGEYAFSGCTKINSVWINSLKSWCNIDFANSSSNPLWLANNLCINGEIIKELIIPDNVNSIGNYTFQGYKRITSVTISNNVTSIGSSAFKGCSNLTSINIPCSMNTVANDAFSGCTSLTDVRINSDALVSKSYTSSFSLSSLFGKQVKNIFFDDSIKEIGNYAFNGFTNITSISIPNSVTSIGSYAFAGCSKLSAALLSDNIGSIGENVFEKACKIYANRGALTLLALWEGNYNVYDKSKFNRHENGNLLERPSIKLLSVTQTTITYTALNIDYDYIFSWDIDQNVPLPNKEYTMRNLWPGEGRYYYLYAKLNEKDEKRYQLYYVWAQTNPLELTIDTSIGPSSITAKGSYIIGDANVAATTLSIYKDATLNNLICSTKDNEINVIGLEPNQGYYGFYELIILNEKTITPRKYKTTIKILTPQLNITTLQPKVTNKGEAIVCATTNIADEETNVGFEWRKVDAPDVVPSKTGTAAIYDGTMEGMIKNLDASTYWKVRPYYESAAGNKYYGEWVGFDPSDFSYFEPTVHTYANAVVTEGAAVLTGYVMAGSDAIEEQGFEYWLANMGKSRSNRAPSSGIQRVTGTGQRMVVQLLDLQAGTTYTYRAFVKTNRGTTYGEEMTFTTKANVTDIVETVTSDETNLKIIGYYNLQGRKLSKPEKGKLNIIRYSDGTTKKVITAP